MNTITINFENPAHLVVLMLIFLATSLVYSKVGFDVNEHRYDDDGPLFTKLFIGLWGVIFAYFIGAIIGLIFNSL